MARQVLLGGSGRYDTGKPLILDYIYTLFSSLGGYPFCHTRQDISWAEVSKYLSSAVIARTIDHDLRAGGGRRDARIVKSTLRIALKYAGQTTSMRTIARELNEQYNADVTERQTRDQLEFLENSLLIRMVEPLQLRCRKDKPQVKICICDHALRASWLKEIVKLASPDRHEMDLAGHIIESTIGYVLSTTEGIGTSYFPGREGEPEVDYVIEIGERRIPVEVKYRNDPLRSENLDGLRSFISNKLYNASFGLLLTKDTVAVQGNIVAVPVKSFLLLK